jgi:hypothetical protein
MIKQNKKCDKVEDSSGIQTTKNQNKTAKWLGKENQREKKKKTKTKMNKKNRLYSTQTKGGQRDKWETRKIEYRVQVFIRILKT